MKRLALVGYGRIAPKHLEVFRALGADVVASCNRSVAGRQAAMNEGGITSTYADLGQMLDEVRPDGIVCCTSFMSVAAVAEQLIPRQIPILFEKPPGISLEEYENIVRLAKEHECPAMVALNRRHYSVFRNAVDDAGGFDKITDVSVEWSENPEHLLTSRGFTAEAVERFIFANSLHGVDLLSWLAGDIGELDIHTLRLNGEDFRWLMSAHGVTDRGVLASFRSNWDCPGGWRVTFCAKGRRYEFSPLEKCIALEVQGGSRKIPADDYDERFKPGFYRQGRSFLNLVDGKRDGEAVSLEAVRSSMVLAERLTVSILTQ